MAEIHYKSKSLDNIVAGELCVKYNTSHTRVLRYYVDFRHKILNLHKELSAPEIFILQNKVDALMASWDEKLLDHEKRKVLKTGKSAADEMTVEAGLRLDAISNILKHTLKVDDRVNWESLKDFTPFSKSDYFSEAEPELVKSPEPIYHEPKIGFLDYLFNKKIKILNEYKKKYEISLQIWREVGERNQKSFEEAMVRWRERKARFQKKIFEERQAYLEKQRIENAKIDALVGAVLKGESQAVLEHVSMVLDKSDYGDLFEKSFEIDYLDAEKLLLVEYELPSPDIMPTLKAVKFIQTSGELRETYISDKDKKANFDSACFQICLRTIHEIFEADVYKNVECVLFNGYVTAIDKTVGQSVRSCIMSVLVNRSEFEAIELELVDPKACFKKLKGVSASTLSALASIAPVMEIDKSDRRFIDARDTVDNLEQGTNLAAMNWDDFEHLVRELFEKEFSLRGGEVKITQSSSDGGVDAVAFDADPITGGKIVIQAKRYTRTVGVSAVRDLYGTLLSEGASKGILVTTADYGPDAHKFATGKPITLMSGSNLLHLLNKHGYNMKIDLREARQELNLKN